MGDSRWPTYRNFIQPTTPVGTDGTPLNTSASPGVIGYGPAGRQSYRSVILAPTQSGAWGDLAGIVGSASKTIYVTGFSMTMQSTAAALQAIYFVKRSTADTNGTPTAGTAVPEDSGSVAATASVMAFTASPTAGTLVGNLSVSRLLSATLTAAPANVGIGSVLVVGTPVQFNQALTLRGVGEGIYVNYNGATLTAGWVADFHFEWVEF